MVLSNMCKHFFSKCRTCKIPPRRKLEPICARIPNWMKKDFEIDGEFIKKTLAECLT